MYVSLTDIAATVATLIVVVLGFLLLVTKFINWYRRKDDLKDDK